MRPMSDALAAAVAAVPPGAWAIGVSGGADSVALASLMAALRPDCRIVIVHLDHQLRGEESDADATFVRALGDELNVPVEVAPRDAIEATMARLPANPSARYRAARFAWFAQIVRRHELAGVLLAHHADDHAETILLHLLRGRGLTNLTGIRRGPLVLRDLGRMFGIRPAADLPPSPWPLTVRRPLLGVRRQTLRDWLTSAGRTWREDSSNASPKYRRNIVRQVLAANPPLTPLLLELSAASMRLRTAVKAAAPRLEREFPTRALRIAPILARTAAMRWLIDRGVPPARITAAVCQQLINQAIDVTRPCRQHYPGRVLVRRRAGRVDVIPSPPVQSRHDHGQETARPAEL